ncbi:MAG: hypothetical protein KDD47_13915 [Acidobacteria bacterium]|nr:hypothetical protein [Acidobacteriota bacterium]
MPKPSEAGGETWFRRLTFFSLLAGLCPLIPLPFVDDWVLSRVRLYMGREILGLRRLIASPEDLRTLVGLEKKGLWQGCFALTVILPLFKLAVYLIRKIVRKIVLILTLKECSDRFSEVLHEGYLLHAATLRGDLEGEAAGTVPTASARAVRRGIVQACDEVDPRPVHQLIKRGLRGSRWLLATGARRLAAAFRRGRKDPSATEAGLEGEERLLATLVDRLSSSLWLQAAYWQELEEHYLRSVSDARQHPALSSDGPDVGPREAGPG